MKTLTHTLLALTLLFSTASVFANGLLDALTSQLGVSSEQASGGAGSLFQMAQNNLSAEDFSQIASVVPGIDKMMASAQSSSKESGAATAVASMLGGDSSAGNLASLASAFGNLGMDSNMVGQFVPIVLQYLQSAGGENIMSMMKGALSL
ncbi:MAG: DUF2780 domain-containing protein [Candidatus Thiodiazotropha lotti]|uniref:DUF2780 domain-containing protein n=1 Tax=Candidatus Thiodiazotropha lotti TaxID=2792787 RepID=A0A9E4N094_9GAMM|nr:DUF2780 domain-containing protein [Candidatus Thiodiazotropha lotti]MCG7921721.1 DUF2780 domain-containing protein [Candidatus Thiodiazotropha lotti]MCG7929713.1 DUF2780 domain-containing protein [Candidatus Thiodiazotropha lotti]MCG7940307.1 DUF2780 domain-containing protein [Candidatus Thiodiazotropha lotti]MCG7986891.1 DUF2780 domain-containing protein [Candidatus Thiodiazotropha lotti]